MSLPVSLEIEEVIDLGKGGSLFDEQTAKDALCLGMESS